MALGAGPLDVPLGPLQALSTFLPNDASPLAAETESILKNLRTIQEQARASSATCDPAALTAAPAALIAVLKSFRPSRVSWNLLLLKHGSKPVSWFIHDDGDTNNSRTSHPQMAAGGFSQQVALIDCIHIDGSPP